MRYFNTTFINQTVNNPTNSYNLDVKKGIFGCLFYAAVFFNNA